MTCEGFRALQHEVNVMKALAHENITGFVTVFHDEKITYVVLEFVGGGGTRLALRCSGACKSVGKVVLLRSYYS